jgi:hypothetical protein
MTILRVPCAGSLTVGDVDSIKSENRVGLQKNGIDFCCKPIRSNVIDRSSNNYIYLYIVAIGLLKMPHFIHELKAILHVPVKRAKSQKNEASLRVLLVLISGIFLEHPYTLTIRGPVNGYR